MSAVTMEKGKKELCFNNKRSCGLWLALVGAVLLAALAFGGRFLINPVIFLAGYYISFYIANINKKVRTKLSQGPASKFQIRMIFISIAFLFFMMFCIAGPYIPSMNWRMIWLGVNLATGLHFSGFYFVHGKSMLAIGAVCTVLSVCGYIFADHTTAFLLADAAAKLIFGIYLLVFGKPTKAYIRSNA